MSIGYCKKCKLVYHEPGVCTCGRKLNTDNDQYLDAYIEHGFVLFVPKTTVSDEKSEVATILQDKRLSRREEKRKQREQILKDSAEENFHETESEFDTVAFLNSLGLRVKNSES